MERACERREVEGGGEKEPRGALLLNLSAACCFSHTTAASFTRYYPLYKSTVNELASNLRPVYSPRKKIMIGIFSR